MRFYLLIIFLPISLISQVNYDIAVNSSNAYNGNLELVILNESNINEIALNNDNKNILKVVDLLVREKVF